jgi:hypothetical protein
VYNNTDTVFVYNLYFNKFTPLYVFNVHDGDTVKLPILPLDGVELTVLPGVDSVFSFVVDSVRMKQYDTTFLKTVYSRAIGNPALRDSNYVYDYGSLYLAAGGVYADKIGATTVGFMPTGSPFISSQDESVQSLGAVRCYHDSTLSIKMTTDICGIIAPSNVALLQKKALSVFPNPANQVLTIDNLTAHSTIEIADMAGRMVYGPVSVAANSLSVPVRQLPVGMYILKVTGIDGVTDRRKISVVH